MSSEDYDKKAMQFYKDTNIWPIGKDAPKGQLPDTEYEIRAKAYRYWCKVKAENKALKKIFFTAFDAFGVAVGAKKIEDLIREAQNDPPKL